MSALNRKRVVPNPENGDFDAYLDDQYIGSFPTETQAWVELDRLACDHIAHGITDVIDPCSPFAVDAFPSTLDVDDSTIHHAYERLCLFFHHSPEVQKRAKRALKEIALLRFDTVTLMSNLEVLVEGTRSYKIRREPLGLTCSCPDFWPTKRQALHTGCCKHIIAIELIRMAEAEEAVATESALAFVEINGQLLGLAFGIARFTAQPVTIQVSEQHLTIRAGDGTTNHETTLACIDGTGQATIQIAPEEFGALWQLFRPVASSLDRLTVFVEQGQIALSAGKFSAHAVGIPIAA